MASSASEKTEIFLITVARSSLEELMVDYQDYLRQHGLEIWNKEHPKARFIRNLARIEDKSYATYQQYVDEKSPETAANTMICVINQSSYLLRRIMVHLENKYASEGGMSERMRAARHAAKRKPK